MQWLESSTPQIVVNLGSYLNSLIGHSEEYLSDTRTETSSANPSSRTSPSSVEEEVYRLRESRRGAHLEVDGVFEVL